MLNNSNCCCSFSLELILINSCIVIIFNRNYRSSLINGKLLSRIFIINVSTASSKWWPRATLLHPSAFATEWSEPLLILAQREQGFGSFLISKMIFAISVFITLYHLRYAINGNPSNLSNRACIPRGAHPGCRI